MAELLVEEVSPLGNVQAVVEADERACYFYLYGAPDEDFGMRSVWVRNLTLAPAQLDVAGMRRGEAPVNPAKHCRTTSAAAPPRKEALRVLWLPEGNGAALYERDELLAMIPPWSGEDGFHGFARDCIGQGPVAWQLPEEPELTERFAAAAAFWEAWELDPWPAMRDSMLETLERQLGPRSSYYAIDGDSWPPRALIRIPTSAGIALVTIGVSALPQPNVEVYAEDPRAIRRIELAALLPANTSDDDVKRFAAYLSGQAGLPWSKFTWLGQGHTVPCDAWGSPQFTVALLVTDHPLLPRIELPTRFSDPVSILWFVPISEAERALAKEQGSAALIANLPASRWHSA